MILMIDNYDSFTYNIVQYLKELGESVYTVRNDEVDYDYIDNELKPRCIVISPGPKSPIDAGQSLDVIDKYKGRIPILGVCLGHQCIGHAFGGEITKAKILMHGKNSKIKSLNKGIFQHFPQEHFIVTRYHSLVINQDNFPSCLEITCESEDGEIMGVRHRDYLIEGVQFHPEAIQSEYGLEIFKRFLAKCPSQKSTQIADNTSFQSEMDAQNLSKKINFEQKISEYTFSGNFYDVFCSIYNTNNYESCAFFDSASGPRKDVNISTIGVDNLFSLKLKNGLLHVEAKSNDYKETLDNILKNHLNQMANGAFDLGTRKFSEVYQLLKNSIKIQKESTIKLPLSFPLVGYFGYEYIHYLERIPLVDKDSMYLPDMELHFYSTLLVHEIEKNKVYVINNWMEGQHEHLNNEYILSFLEDRIDSKPCKIEKIDSPKLNYLEGQRTISKEDYLNIIAQNKDYIISGDIFQVQVSIREDLDLTLKAIDLYSELRDINPSPYMCFLKTPEFELVCNSPELQFSIKDNKAMIRPIAGTSPGKGTDDKSRKEILEKFSHDAKENAEHLMLVDLARNDLGRMATTGTVKVDELMAIEEYANVFHLTSTVTCELQQGLNPFELFEATFPAGTLTGAPKIRSMEIIAEHEPEKRGLYGGAIGIFDLDTGNIMSSIIIRSVICKDNKLHLQAAAGTVADSVPEREWNEINHKLSTVKKAIQNVLNRA